LKIRNFSSGNSTTLLINYIDNVSFAPVDYLLRTDQETFSLSAGNTVSFYLEGGPAQASQYYLMIAGFSGCYPGFDMDGVNVPLNWDMLVGMCFNNPGFIAPGFFGQFDGNGQAMATMTVPNDQSLLDLALFYSYIVLSPGPSPPVLEASNAINTIIVK
jgi:hypothetical protein